MLFNLTNYFNLLFAVGLGSNRKDDGSEVIIRRRDDLIPGLYDVFKKPLSDILKGLVLICGHFSFAAFNYYPLL